MILKHFPGRLWKILQDQGSTARGACRAKSESLADGGLYVVMGPARTQERREGTHHEKAAGAVTIGQADGPGLAARTQATGGLRGRVWVFRCVKPAPRSKSSISRAALRDVSAVAPGQRGWDAMATRPPGARRRRSSASRSAGAGQNPRVLTARMASKGPSRAGGI